MFLVLVRFVNYARKLAAEAQDPCDSLHLGREDEKHDEDGRDDREAPIDCGWKDIAKADCGNGHDHKVYVFKDLVLLFDDVEDTSINENDGGYGNDGFIGQPEYSK